MSRYENDLNAALRMLAEAGPREAPQHVEAALKEAFRRHRVARRFRSGIVVAIAAGAAAASIAVFTWMAPRPAGPPERVAGRTVPPPPMAWAKQPVSKPKAQRVPAAPSHQPTRRPATAP